jgi:hypothetical protein
MRRPLFAALTACALAAGLAPADDKKPAPITVDLKTFKFTPAFEGGGDLFGYNEGEERLFFYTNGAGEAAVTVPADGEYTIAVKAAGEKVMNEWPKFKLAVDGQPVGKETALTSDDPKEYTFTAPLKAGSRKVKIEFTNDVYKDGEYDRNLYVHAVTLTKK